MPSTRAAALPATADWDALVADLRAERTPVLAAHVHPDGDALGCALAVGIALLRLGAHPLVTFGDEPLVVPTSLAHLPGQDLLTPVAALPERPGVVVAFDTASLDRLGALQPVWRRARTTYAVDHHPSYTGFADHAVIDVAAPATAVLATELVDRLGVPIDADIAACLYTGLTTDTGSFRFAGTTPATHQLAARLLATGIRHDVIARHVWDTTKFGYLKVLAAVLDRAVLEPDAACGLGLVWAPVPRTVRETSGIALDEVEGVIDVLRRTVEAEVAAVLKEGDDGGWKVSLRSKGRVDVSAVAVRLGGGGHRYAAGFAATGGVDAVLAALRAELAVSVDREE